MSQFLQFFANSGQNHLSDCWLHFMPWTGGKNHHKSSALLEGAGILIKINKKKSKHRAGMKRHSPGAAASF